MRPLRSSLPLRDATHELLEAVGLMTISTAAFWLLLTFAVGAGVL